MRDISEQFDQFEYNIERPVLIYEVPLSEFNITTLIICFFRYLWGTPFAGLYHTKKEVVFILEGMPGPIQEHIYRHEMQHAQDNHNGGLNMGKYMTATLQVSFALSVITYAYFLMTGSHLGLFAVSFAIYFSIVLHWLSEAEEEANDRLEPLHKIIRRVNGVTDFQLALLAVSDAALAVSLAVLYGMPKAIVLSWYKIIRQWSEKVSKLLRLDRLKGFVSAFDTHPSDITVYGADCQHI